MNFLAIECVQPNRLLKPTRDRGQQACHKSHATVESTWYSTKTKTLTHIGERAAPREVAGALRADPPQILLLLGNRSAFRAPIGSGARVPRRPVLQTELECRMHLVA